ncbi:hypothetical protein VNI00_015840 [Paramarasmius palmivorus]|uniref:Uncharacterized protein n=1 Tax=Paramarasmius palmivorus TaxID=297713 RepID=A0AAW0BHQ7_9AGAR
MIIGVLETFPNIICLPLHPAFLVRQAPSPALSPPLESITILQTDHFTSVPASISFRGLTKYLGGFRIEMESRSFPSPVMALSYDTSLTATPPQPRVFSDESKVDAARCI